MKLTFERKVRDDKNKFDIDWKNVINTVKGADFYRINREKEILEVWGNIEISEDARQFFNLYWNIMGYEKNKE